MEMKKSIIFIVLFSVFFSVSGFCQFSLYGGYGTQGPNLRFNYDLDKELFSSFGLSFYGEVGMQGYKFDQPNFTFQSTNYSSNTRLTFAGFGLEGSLEGKTLFLSPYVGIRYIYARFTDQALFDAIGTDNLIRLQNGQKVGPTVENAYGNSITFDVGCRLGIKFSEKLALIVSGGISPVKFQTSTTLFGPYWGEAPYPNSYYIEYPIYRAEAGLRYSF